MERKLQRAEEKRQHQLKKKVKKAHEEEIKANEIAFINTLEAQNKRHEILSKHQESEARLQDKQVITQKNKLCLQCPTLMNGRLIGNSRLFL